MDLLTLSNNILSSKIITNISYDFRKFLNINQSHNSMGIMTVKTDLLAYTAFDEVTKFLDVEVIYAKSTYCGHQRATTKLAGEFIGIICGENPDEIKDALNFISHYMDRGAGEIQFANDDEGIPFYCKLISKPGSYFSNIANSNDEALCFLIAPPLEAVYAIDAALKATSAHLRYNFAPPTATNFSGAILGGSESTCREACLAFTKAMNEIAKNPKDSLKN